MTNNMRTHHTDELDELEAHSDHHRFFEVIDRSDHFVVTSEKSFDQLCLIRGGAGETWDKQDMMDTGEERLKPLDQREINTVCATRISR